MTYTLMPGDYFMSNPRKFAGQDPSRGDLIVFLFPRDPSLKYVKRVIGLPGETIVIKGGEVLVNGVRLQEPYVSIDNNREPQVPGGKFAVPDGHFFVLGDNRDNSSDSRHWGYVPRSNLYGNIEYIWFSLDSVYGIRTERIGLRPQ
jgi:signal peptidase I